MNVASLELANELFELSGWEGMYTLGYLLRKLPNYFHIEKRVELKPSTRWMAYHSRYSTDHVRVYASTPEDAAAKLAIELFKQGVLKKEESDGS